MKLNLLKKMFAGTVLLFLMPTAQSAISLDRTRVIFPGGEKSLSLNVSNQNTSLPYLAQGWIEDANGNKLAGDIPLTLLPPVQRIEPGSKSQIKIQAMPGTKQLPQDKETLFYLNLREIPPKSNKPNTLQIALQTRIKLFYRPEALIQDQAKKQAVPFQERMTLNKSGNTYMVNNPTPYYITLIGALAGKGGESVKGFDSVMIEPYSSAPLGGNVSELGNSPTLVYVNDYGGQPVIKFLCNNGQCKVDGSKRDNKQ